MTENKAEAENKTDNNQEVENSVVQENLELKNKENKLDKFITNNDIIKFVKYKKIKQTNNNLDTTNKRRSLSF